MGVLKYFLPNFDGFGVVGFVLLVAGIIVFAASFFVSPFPRISAKVRAVGVIAAVAGLLWWVLGSFVDNLLSDPKVRVVLFAAAALLVVGFLLFWEPRLKGRKR